MKDPYPYAVLGFDTEQVTDEQVRSAYIDGVRRYPPEHHPEAFQRIHHAFEQIETEQKRLKRRYAHPAPPWDELLDAMPENDLRPPVPRRLLMADLLEACTQQEHQKGSRT